MAAHYRSISGSTRGAIADGVAAEGCPSDLRG